MTVAESRAEREARNVERYGTRGMALDLTNLDETSEEEIHDHLLQWSDYTRVRGIYYAMNALSFLVDNRPDFAKLATLGNGGNPSGLVGHPARPLLENVRDFAEYIRLGWEPGIYNEARELQQLRGCTKAQINEIIMYAQLSGGGIRAIGHVHNALGKSFYDWQDSSGAIWPEGWAADPDAFKCGLDLSVGDMTESDRRNLEAWYESTLGWIPKWVRFGLKHNPRALKWQRAKWERAIKTLPKQVAPYLMLAQHALTGSREGLREGALLAKAWGFTADWVVEPISGMAYYYKGLEVPFEAAFDAIDDILDDWDR